MRSSQWQWLRSSFERPTFSEPNKRATCFERSRLRISRAPSSSRRTGCCNSRRPRAEVPTTSVQSATASATLWNSSALARSEEAPTAERASRNATWNGFTTRRRKKPKLLMARAAAPMLRGLRVATRTTRKLSNSVEATKNAYSKTTQDIHIIAVSDELLVRGPSTLVPGGGIEPPRAEARRILSSSRTIIQRVAGSATNCYELC